MRGACVSITGKMAALDSQDGANCMATASTSLEVSAGWWPFTPDPDPDPDPENTRMKLD